MKLITKDSRRLAKNEWNTIFVGKVWAKFVKLVAPLVGKYPKAHCKDFVDSEKKKTQNTMHATGMHDASLSYNVAPHLTS